MAAKKKTGPVVLFAKTEGKYTDVQVYVEGSEQGECPKCGNSCDYCDNTNESLCWDAATMLDLKENKLYKLTIKVEEVKK